MYVDGVVSLVKEGEDYKKDQEDQVKLTDTQLEKVVKNTKTIESMTVGFCHQLH